jgi:hypothetical protein
VELARLEQEYAEAAPPWRRQAQAPDLQVAERELLGLREQENRTRMEVEPLARKCWCWTI